jgi:Domain of unknown function (DUF4371)
LTGLWSIDFVKMQRFFKKALKSHVDSSSSSNHSHEVSTDENPPSDPALRPPISHYNPNERDRIRRYYLTNGPCQPYNCDFPQSEFTSGLMRRFNTIWFDKYKTWLEYSVSKDAVFCLPCYLFRPEILGSGGRTNFVGEGFRNWKKSTTSFEEHIGASNSRHNEAERKCAALMNERQNIQAMIERQSVRQGMEYRIQLNATVDTIRFLLRQGLPFRGHDESESSDSKGLFLEQMRFLGDHNKEIDEVILDNAPQNLKLVAPEIQKDIVNACAEETIQEILTELGDELFSVMVDEARDASTKEQMAVVIRYVNKRGCIVERFLGIVHVFETTAITLKMALEDLFGKYDLALSRLRGQGYDGASNMSGEFNGLKALILSENNSAYYVHCFAHQLQLTLIAVASDHNEVCLFFQMVDTILNVAGGSCKRRDQLRENRRAEVVEAIASGKIRIGRGLNQETGLARAGPTRWSSHLVTLNSMIILFSATLDVLEEIKKEGSKQLQRAQAHGLQRAMQKFEFVFLLHLMRNSLLITHDLSQTLQKKDQDIVNAMRLVKSAKIRLQKMRDSGWEELLKEVCEFCEEHNIQVLNMVDLYVDNPRNQTSITNLHYYRVNLFYTVIDMQLQELNNRFTEINTELLICVSCLDPKNSFSSFNKDRLLQLAQFYPSDFN